MTLIGLWVPSARELERPGESNFLPRMHVCSSTDWGMINSCLVLLFSVTTQFASVVGWHLHLHEISGVYLAD